MVVVVVLMIGESDNENSGDNNGDGSGEGCCCYLTPKRPIIKVYYFLLLFFLFGYSIPKNYRIQIIITGFSESRMKLERYLAFISSRSNKAN